MQKKGNIRNRISDNREIAVYIIRVIMYDQDRNYKRIICLSI